MMVATRDNPIPSFPIEFIQWGRWKTVDILKSKPPVMYSNAKMANAIPAKLATFIAMDWCRTELLDIQDAELTRLKQTQWANYVYQGVNYTRC